MANRLYLAPRVWAGRNRMGWRPKTIWTYKANPPGWFCSDYAHHGAFLVAGDFPDAIHDAIVADPDVYALPLDLDVEIGGNLALVQSVLEGYKIPADWIQETHTYRRVLKLMAAAFRFMRRVAKILNITLPVIADAVTLDTQFQDLPVTARQAMLQAAEELNLDSSGLTPASPLRQILKAVADQMPPVVLNGIEL
jgi:hypothetical protein